jgi:hypothetical protein
MRWYLPTLRRRVPVRARAATTAAVALALCALIWQTNITRLYGGLAPTLRTYVRHIDARRFPVEAADLLKTMGFEGTVFAHARYGGYLLWRLHPNVRTLIDGRLNVPPDVARDVNRVHQVHRKQATVPEAAQFTLDTYNRFATDAIVMETPAFAAPTASCDWLPVLRTPKLEVYLRNAQTNADNLRRAGFDPENLPVCEKSVTKNPVR